MLLVLEFCGVDTAGARAEVLAGEIDARRHPCPRAHRYVSGNLKFAAESLPGSVSEHGHRLRRVPAAQLEKGSALSQ